MSERYTKLFSLSENLYAKGAPIVIAAGALLKDNQTGKIIAQLKLRNIGKLGIRAAKVSIQPFDTVGKPIGDSVYQQYLDIDALRNEEFGQKVAIVLPDAATRSFSAKVEEVAFANKSVWNAVDEPWEVLPSPSPIRKIYGAEFEKQFKIKYGQNCENFPLSEKDLWYCACGALNRLEETNCHSCGKVYAEISSFSVDELNAEKDVRLAKEKAQAEEAAEQARVQAEENRKKVKKLAKIMVPIVVIAIIAIIAVSAFTATQAPKKYASAISMMVEEKYDEAASIFIALDDYEDSATYLQEIYDKAFAMLTEGEYEQAAKLFTALGDYKDSGAMKEKSELAVWVVSQKAYIQLEEIATNSESINVRYDAVKAHFILESITTMELEKNSTLMRGATEATLQGMAIQQYNTFKETFAPFEEKGVSCIVNFITIAGGETYIGSSYSE